MAGKRIVLVGAGSAVFGTGLIEGATRQGALHGSTIVLLGHTPERAEITRALAARIIDRAGAGLRLQSTLDPVEALEGADYVVSALGVGGLAARRADVEIPMEYGVVQTKGDSTGPGGLSRALRAVPPLLALAREMERRCPRAWLLNYSNPMTPICTALSRATGIRVVGLCDGIAMARTFLAGYLGVAPDRVTSRCAGVNHASWLTEVRLDGANGYPALWRRLEEVGVQGEPVSFALLELYGLYPSPADVHVAEFFPHFLNPAADHGRAWGLEPWPAERFLRQRAADDDLLRRRALGQTPLEATTAAVGEAAMAMDIIAALEGAGEMEFTANMPNRGEVADLPLGAVVEMPAVATAGDIRGLEVGPLPVGIAAFCQARLAQQGLVADAALAGDREQALRALMMDPLMGWVSLAQGREMLGRLLEAQARYLPQFARA